MYQAFSTDYCSALRPRGPDRHARLRAACPAVEVGADPHGVGVGGWDGPARLGRSVAIARARSRVAQYAAIVSDSPGAWLGSTVPPLAGLITWCRRAPDIHCREIIGTQEHHTNTGIHPRCCGRATPCAAATQSRRHLPGRFGHMQRRTCGSRRHPLHAHEAWRQRRNRWHHGHLRPRPHRCRHT